MESYKTFGDYVLVRLDAENDRIKTKNGIELYLDTSYEPEKHVTVTGIVCGVPSRLSDNIPWKTDIEVQIGDRVIVYYLSVMNAFSKNDPKYFIKNGKRYVFINYRSIFVVIRQEKIIPINGYCLIKPMEDPFWIQTVDKLLKLKIVPVRFDLKSNTKVVFGQVKYLSKPIKEYIGGQTDEGIDIKEGDNVIMKRVTDVPLQYELHSNIDGGAKYYRVQRRYIYAKF